MLIVRKHSAMFALRDEADEARFGPLLAATPKGDIRHLIPRSNAVEQMGEGASPAMLLFPRFGFDPATRPVARSECFMRLTQASTNYVALGEAGLDRKSTRLNSSH